MYVVGKLPNNSDFSQDDDNDEYEPFDIVLCRRLIRDYGIAIIPGSFYGSPGFGFSTPIHHRIGPSWPLKDCPKGSKT